MAEHGESKLTSHDRLSLTDPPRLPAACTWTGL